MSALLDTLIPLFVGHRTQLTALALLAVQGLTSLGILSPDATAHAQGVLGPAALAFLAAKIDRVKK